MRPTSTRRSFSLLALHAVAAAAAVAGCSSDEAPPAATVTCGPGTTLDAGVCYAATAPPAGNPDGGVASDATTQPSGPTAPTFAGATSVAPTSATGIQITWAAATDAVTPAAKLRYNVYVGTAKGGQNFGVATATTPPGATSHVVNGLVANTEYFVVVRAVNEAKLEDKNAAEKSGKPQDDTSAPAFSGVKSVAPESGGSVTLTWDAAQDDLTPGPGMAYLVYGSETAGGQNFSVPDAITAPGVSSVTVRGLSKPNGTYHFVVRARDAAGNFETNKIEASGKSGPDTEPPLFAGCASAVVKDASSVTVAWSPAIDDTTPPARLVYDVYASKTAGAQDFASPTATFTGTSLGVVTGLTQATPYYFVCRARDVSNNAETNTSERSATTLSDATPPTFAGLTTITNITATKVDLNWAASTDDQTPQAEMVYDVYEATSPGGQNFANPQKISSPAGATTIALTNLTPATTLYWVVRARDKAGNRDSNLIEKSAATGASFALNVQPILTQHCAVVGCHVPGNPPNGLILSPGFAYSSIVDVASVEVPSLKRILAGSPTNSYLFKKITGTHSVGEIMPPPSTNDVLSTSEKTIIESWITQGAPSN